MNTLTLSQETRSAIPSMSSFLKMNSSERKSSLETISNTKEINDLANWGARKNEVGESLLQGLGFGSIVGGVAAIGAATVGAMLSLPAVAAGAALTGVTVGLVAGVSMYREARSVDSEEKDRILKMHKIEQESVDQIEKSSLKIGAMKIIGTVLDGADSLKQGIGNMLSSVFGATVENKNKDLSDGKLSVKSPQIDELEQFSQSIGEKYGINSPAPKLDNAMEMRPNESFKMTYIGTTKDEEGQKVAMFETATGAKVTIPSDSFDNEHSDPKRKGQAFNVKMDQDGVVTMTKPKERDLSQSRSKDKGIGG